jgi:hypothetical protein
LLFSEKERERKERGEREERERREGGERETIRHWAPANNMQERQTLSCPNAVIGHPVPLSLQYDLTKKALGSRQQHAGATDSVMPEYRYRASSALIPAV